MMDWKLIVVSTAKTIIVIGIVGFLGGCGTQSVKSEVMVPAKYSEAAKLRRVAVLPFVENNRIADIITADVEATITSVRIDDKPYFSVIERNQMRKIIDEQRLGSTGLIDQNTAVRVGKIAGVEAILMGNVTQSGLDRSHFYKTMRRCSIKDSDGKCKSWSDVRVHCNKRTANFAFVPKMINVTSGALVMSESITRQSQSIQCGNEHGPSDSDLLILAKSASLQEFANLIAPHYVSQQMVLLSKDDSNPPEAVKNKIDGGIEFAKAGRMDRACSLWEDAETIHRDGYVIPYLLGVCAETTGEYAKANRYYRLADSRTNSPVAAINKALERIGTKSLDESKLQRQLVKNISTNTNSSTTTRRAQQLLVESGYNPGPADGMMGQRTREAIRQYQQDQGLDPSGELDPPTKNALGLE